MHRSTRPIEQLGAVGAVVELGGDGRGGSVNAADAGRGRVAEVALQDIGEGIPAALRGGDGKQVEGGGAREAAARDAGEDAPRDRGAAAKCREAATAGVVGRLQFEGGEWALRLPLWRVAALGAQAVKATLAAIVAPASDGLLLVVLLLHVLAWNGVAFVVRI